MVDNEVGSVHQRAISHYLNGNYKAAAISFELWRRRSKSQRVDDDALYVLSVVADQALCRFRAATDAEFRKEVLYREAILANERYLASFRQLQQHQGQYPLDAGLLATISAIWIHTKMDNVRMARHKAWDFLQWAVSIPESSAGRMRATGKSPRDVICTIEEAVSLLSQSVSTGVLRKFCHVLHVLDLLQGKDLMCLMEKDRQDPLLPIDQQEEALIMLFRRSRGLTPTAFVSGSSGIAFKIRTLIRAVEQTHEEYGSIGNALQQIVDDSNPSDLNLLGCFQGDCQHAIATFKKALKHLEPNDVELGSEIIFNMADCFLRLGEYGRAKDLLMWSLQPKQHSSSSNTIRIAKGNPTTKDEVLWRAFVAATLDNDPIATLTVSDLLSQESQSEATKLALVFGLYQAGRPSLAKRHECDMTDDFYVAISGNEQPELRGSQLSHIMDHGVVSASFVNSLGLLHLREGKIQEAIRCFEKACDGLNAIGSCYLHPYFNLTLILWDIGEVSKAVNVWGDIRCLGKNDISEIEDGLNATLSRYAQPGHAMTVNKTWLANGVGGLEPCWVFLLDCLVLQHRLQCMQAKALENLLIDFKKS